MIPIFQPKSICPHVTRIYPHLKAQRGGGSERERESEVEGENGEEDRQRVRVRERDCVSTKLNINILHTSITQSDMTSSFLAGEHIYYIHPVFWVKRSIVYFSNLGVIFLVLDITHIRYDNTLLKSNV